MASTSVFRFLFRLAADAPRISRDRLQRRLVTGLANHFGATVCALYLDEDDRPLVSADPGSEIDGLAEADRDGFADLDRRLVTLAKEKGGFASALELDEEGDIVRFLDRTLHLTDIFAFPLMGLDGPKGAVLLYLPENATPVGEADVHALQAIREVLLLQEDGAG